MTRLLPNRRDFLKSSALAGLALGAPAIIRAADPGKRYTVALIGSGWWGMNILREALASNQTRLLAICDVDQGQMSRAADLLAKMTSDVPKKYGDYRELLAREKPEIVINATPDHWHPLITIDAVKSGAHVYVEKPVGHTIREGRAMVNAARAANRVVQVGTHRRVSPHNVSGIEFLRSGKAGRIGMCRAFVHYGGGPESPQANEEPPSGLDWNMWCGPAPLRPFNRRIHPKGFRQFLDYANGTLGDWGIHWMDQILFWTEEKYPRRIFASGGRYIKGPAVNTPQAQTTDAPDTLVVTFEFESFTAVWEHRQYAANNTDKGENVGVYFYGTEGILHQGWKDGWTFYPTDGRKPPINEPARLNQPDDQNIKELWANFMDAIRTGGRPASDIELGHRSTNMALLGMLSYKTGRAINWDGEKELCINDDEANRLLSRPYRSPWVYPGA